MKTAYFILGMHRSGTSALGGVLNILGLDFGSELMPADEGNPKGYYENMAIYSLNEKILMENNSSWDDYAFDIHSIPEISFDRYVIEAQEILKNEFEYVENFAIKDPRNCMLFPIWEKACKNLHIKIKVIIPLRNPLEVAKSLKKRNNFPYEKSLLLWSRHILSAEYYSRSYKRHFLSYDEMLSKNQTIKKLADFVGKKLKPKKIRSFLDIKIKHNRSDFKNLSGHIPSHIHTLIKIVEHKDFSNKQTLDHIYKEFIYSMRLYQVGNMIEKSGEEDSAEKKMLEDIKDLLYVDPDFYLREYTDLQQYTGTPEEHFFLYGKKEGRYPNAYTKAKQIDTIHTPASQSERLFFFKQESEKLTDMLATLEATVAQKDEEIATLQQQLSDTNEAILSLEAATAQKDEEITRKDEEIASLQQQLSDTNETILSLETTIVKKDENITRKDEEIASLQQELSTLKVTLEEKTNEIRELNQNIDNVVEDLANIKESKCWIYTKPIRDLQKVIKGN